MQDWQGGILSKMEGEKRVRTCVGGGTSFKWLNYRLKQIRENSIVYIVV